jgi:hypothetical protein
MFEKQIIIKDDDIKIIYKQRNLRFLGNSNLCYGTCFSVKGKKIINAPSIN